MAWFAGSRQAALERVIGLVGGRGVLWWWRSGGVGDGTTRRDGVDRLAATLIFAGWDRTSAMRRKVPLTRFAMARPWHRALGGSVLQRRRPGASWSFHLLGRSRAGEPVQPELVGIAPQVGILKGLLVVEQQLVHGPEAALERGRLGQMGGHERVGMDAGQGKVPEHEP